MLVLGGFGVVRQDLVALHLADDGQGVDVAAAAAGDGRAQVDQALAAIVASAVVAAVGGALCGFGFLIHMKSLAFCRSVCKSAEKHAAAAACGNWRNFHIFQQRANCD